MFLITLLIFSFSYFYLVSIVRVPFVQLLLHHGESKMFEALTGTSFFFSNQVFVLINKGPFIQLVTLMGVTRSENMLSKCILFCMSCSAVTLFVFSTGNYLFLSKDIKFTQSNSVQV